VWNAGGAIADLVDPAERPADDVGLAERLIGLTERIIGFAERFPGQLIDRSFIERHGRADDGYGLPAARQQQLEQRLEQHVEQHGRWRRLRAEEREVRRRQQQHGFGFVRLGLVRLGHLGFLGLGFVGIERERLGIGVWHGVGFDVGLDGVRNGVGNGRFELERSEQPYGRLDERLGRILAGDPADG
jgi:hypothetical protein